MLFREPQDVARHLDLVACKGDGWHLRGHPLVRWSRGGGKGARERRNADDRHTVVPAQRRDCYMPPQTKFRPLARSVPRPWNLGGAPAAPDLMHWKLSWRRWHTASATLPPGSATGHTDPSAFGRGSRAPRLRHTLRPPANNSRAANSVAMSAGRSLNARPAFSARRPRRERLWTPSGAVEWPQSKRSNAGLSRQSGTSAHTGCG
jgi:hypothetical protein